MRQIMVTIHHEDESWWADSSSLPGFVAAAPTYEQLREELRDGVRFALDDAPFVLVETVEHASIAADGVSGITSPRRAPKMAVSLRYSAASRPISTGKGRVAAA